MARKKREIVFLPQFWHLQLSLPPAVEETFDNVFFVYKSLLLNCNI